MNILLKNARETKSLKTRELAQLSAIDQALISKFETGTRKPTKDQITKLASLLDIDYETLMIAWLKEKILHEIGQEELALKALKKVEEHLLSSQNVAPANHLIAFKKQLDIIEQLKLKTQPFDAVKSEAILEQLALEYTFESNRMEGNTLTLSETDLVINEGQTIAGKSMREHLEAINHNEAIAYIKSCVQLRTFATKDLLHLHQLLLRGIAPKEAGKYRTISITVKDKSFCPSEPVDIQKDMATLFDWYEGNRSSLHPVILAVIMKLKLFTIQPFINGNAKISRLLMNYILLQNDFQIATIKSDESSKLQYHQTLKTSLITTNQDDMIHFILQREKESLERFLKEGIL